MIMPHDFVANLETAMAALKDPALANGAIVECGTWKGGMSAALVEIGGPDRDYYFFDSFEGLPPAKEIDGEGALAYQADKNSPHYRDNCCASLEDFQHTMSLTNLPTNRIHAIKGFFESTFPSFEPTPIALLRLDGDWYDSTMVCLEKFWDHILPGGVVLIDDYYIWDGCSRAVHDFLSRRQSSERIRQGAVGLAYIQRTRP
jgi:O-methyltransferase